MFTPNERNNSFNICGKWFVIGSTMETISDITDYDGNLLLSAKTPVKIKGGAMGSSLLVSHDGKTYSVSPDEVQTISG